MKVLVACEESQAVTIELRKLGHEAYSCDIIDCSGGYPEWHIKWDALALINGNCSFMTCDGELHRVAGKWDLLIAHPPCTYLTNAGAKHLWKGHQLNQERFEKGMEARTFFMAFLNADCERIAVENPIPSKVFELPKYTQTVQPYEYGHPFTKKNVFLAEGFGAVETDGNCGTGTDAVPVRKLFAQTWRKTQRHVYEGQGEESKQNIPRHCKGNGGTMGRTV